LRELPALLTVSFAVGAESVSQWVDLDGPVHFVDHGGPRRGEVRTLVCVHGLGGSHANWHDLGPLLASHHRVLAVDLAGHGRTPRAGRSASVPANRELLNRFLDEVVGEPVVLVGNSMGAGIAMLQAGAKPGTVAGLVLIGPTLPRVSTDLPSRAVARQIALCAVPPLGQRILARRRSPLGAERFIAQTMRVTCADPTRVSLGMRRLAIELLASGAAGPDSEAAFVEAARSVALLVGRAAAYRALIASLATPALVLQGALDRLVPRSGLGQLAVLQPTWPIEVLDGVGHVPQIEIPHRTAEIILGWLGQLDQGRTFDQGRMFDQGRTFDQGNRGGSTAQGAAS
jgi:pimeloyl-ACP methyl ester carboxylesterase